MKIIVTRHGQTEWNRLGKLQGQTDNSLNEEGKAQAEETGKQIADEKIDLIITSPLIRARETAEIINKRFNVPIIEDDRIKERNYGQCEGITLEEFLTKKKYIVVIDGDEYCEFQNMKNAGIINMDNIEKQYPK